jgi:hypothetical protein
MTTVPWGPTAKAAGLVTIDDAAVLTKDAEG